MEPARESILKAVIFKKRIYRPWDILNQLKKNLKKAYCTNMMRQKNVYYHPLHDKGYIGEFAKGFLDTTQILTM